MSIIGVGRSLLRLQYQAVSWPLRLVERQVVGRYLGQESAAHRTAERMVAGLDSTAGRLLGDPELASRAVRQREHAELLDQAARLEREAERTRANADRDMHEEARHAERRRAEAQRERRERVSDAVSDELADRRRVDQQAQEQAEAEKRAADERTKQRRDQAKSEQEAAERRAEARTRAKTATSQRELKEAAEEKAEARQEKRTAAELADLAKREQAERK